MKEVELAISSLVKTQFPEFYVAEGPRFIDFVEQYYVWMESQNQAINRSHSLFNYRDIDKTSSEFIAHFKNKYLNGIPLTTKANTQFLVKHATDLYNAKGTSAGVQMAMRALFNEPATVYYPGDDLFKTSDNIWITPKYLELSVSPRTKSFIGREIVGSRSGAKAFMEALVRKRVSNKIIQVAYLSNLRGDFVTEDYITPTDETNLDQAPLVIGSMTSLTVEGGGANFAVGDIFDVESANGKQGKARVTGISNATGTVNFIYIDALTSGGWGYSVAHANVMVAQKMLEITTITNANTQITNFAQFEGVIQNLANIAYSTARPNNANFSVGAVVENYDANGDVAANAVIVAVSSTNTSAGFIVVAPNFGNVSAVDTTFAIKGTGVAAFFNANSGVANSTEIITTTANHTFVNNDIVIYSVRTGNTALAALSEGAAYYVVGANTTTLTLADTVGGTPINLTAALDEAGHVLTKSLGSGVITAYNNRSATATAIKANTTYLGVVGISSNGFIITPYANVVGVISSTTATISNTSTGTGATFNIGLLTDTETVLLSPDFLYSNNTQNVVFSTINLNGNNSGTFLQFGANGVSESTFNAYSGVANTTDIITTTVAHSFANDNPVVYSVAPGNTALTGLTVGTTYYVVNTSPGNATLKLSATVGGAAINITSGSAESGHYIRLQTGVFYVNANSGVANATSFITTVATPHTFVNSTPVVYRVSAGNTAITGLTNNATYFVANTVSNTQFQLSLTRFPITRKVNAQSDVNANYITPIVNTVSFNSNTGVVNTGNYVVPGTTHNFVNGDIVTYTVATGNTALTGLVNSFSYFVWNANSTAFQVAATERSANNIPITSGVTESGHTFTRYHGLINTNIVQYVTSPGNTAISGLTNNQLYYVVNANTTAFQLATDFYYDVPNVKTYNVVNITSGTNEQGHTLTSIIPVKAGVNETGHLFDGAHHDLSTTDGTFGGFGFVKFPGATLDSILLDCLRLDSTVIGSIATLTGRNTGSDYNVDPFVVVMDPWVYGYNKRDYLMLVSPVSGLFVEGEEILQTFSQPAIQLTVNNFSGTAANGTPTTTIAVTEKIYQLDEFGANRAVGFVNEGAITAGSGSIKLANVTGTFVVTSNTSTQMLSLTTGGTANISAAAVTTISTSARAIVKEVANSSYLKLKRINLESTFGVGNTIIGRVSGATATILTFDEDPDALVVGVNADIYANVQTANAVVTTLQVQDSGFGYIKQETVTLTKEGSEYEVTAIVELGKQGVGNGYYGTTRGFLDSDKKLHDNYYYQEYSYEINTKIPFDEYINVLKQVMHVAGTKAFGRVEATSVVNTNSTIINSIVIT